MIVVRVPQPHWVVASLLCWQALQTALHAACGCGHEEAVEMLLGEPHTDRNPVDKVPYNDAQHPPLL